MKLEYLPGVYCIKNTVTGDCYIGSSVTVKQRCSHHRGFLRMGKHHNPHLQAAWNLYGQERFIFEALEYLEDPALLLQREQQYVDTLHPVYNCRKDVTRNSSLKWSEEAKKAHSEKMKAIFKAKGRRNSEPYRRPIPDEERERIRQTLKGRTRPESTIEKLRQFYKGRQVAQVPPEALQKMAATKRANNALKKSLLAAD